MRRPAGTRKKGNWIGFVREQWLQFSVKDLIAE